MRKQAYMIMTVIMLVAIAGLSTAKAQTSGTTELRANIPFAFSVGDKTLPAGEYTLRCTNPASDMKALLLRSNDGRVSVMVRTNSVLGRTEEDAKLVFNRYGEQYFFAQAWLPADNIGMQAAKSRNERQIARELAATRKAREVVAIAARR